MQHAISLLANDGLTCLFRNKHSSFSSSFPVYLFEKLEKEVPIEDEKDTASEEKSETDEDEAIIEDADDAEKAEPKTRTVLVDDWVQLNAQPPLWMRYVFKSGFLPPVLHSVVHRDPKNVTSIEYGLFYQATFKDFTAQPLAWHHFSGDLGSSISFRAILYVPGKL